MLISQIRVRKNRKHENGLTGRILRPYIGALIQQCLKTCEIKSPYCGLTEANGLQ